MKIKETPLYLLKQPITCVDHWFSQGFRSVTISSMFRDKMNTIALDLDEFNETSIIRTNHISVTERMYLAHVHNEPVIIVPVWKKPLSGENPFRPISNKKWARVENISEVVNYIRKMTHVVKEDSVEIFKVTRATKLDDSFLFIHGFRIENGKHSISRLLEEVEPCYDAKVNNEQCLYNRLVFRKDGQVLFIPKGDLCFYLVTIGYTKNK